MQFIFPKPPPSPLHRQTKAGNKEFPNESQLGPRCLNSQKRNAKKKIEDFRYCRYVHPSGDEEYRKTKQNHQQPFVQSLPVTTGWGAVCPKTQDFHKVWLTTSLALTNAKEALPPGRRDELRSSWGGGSRLGPRHRSRQREAPVTAKPSAVMEKCSLHFFKAQRR